MEKNLKEHIPNEKASFVCILAGLIMFTDCKKLWGQDAHSPHIVQEIPSVSTKILTDFLSDSKFWMKTQVTW